MAAKKLFCPKCGKQHVVKKRGAFVEVGNYDETEKQYCEEWNCYEYVCKDCNAQFAL